METKISKVLNIDATKLQEKSDILKAMAHPIRIAIIEMLHERKHLNVSKIYDILGIEQAVASSHLSVLKNKNILHCKREGKNIIYSIKLKNIHKVIDCMIGW